MPNEIRLLLRGAGCAGVLLLLCAIAWMFDTRTLSGVSVWVKPLKFQLSFGLHLLTLAWLLRYLAAPESARRWARWAVWTALVSSLIELAYISMQAARGRHSHFNFETAWERLGYYGLMGGAALAVVAATAVLGGLIWRYPRVGLAPSLRLGAGLGLLLGALATLITAGVLASGAVAGPGHWVGGIRSDAYGLPLLGWSTTGGDLRVPHFFATHLTQALPLAGWLVSGLRYARAWVVAGALLGLAAVAITFKQALGGLAFAAL